MSARKHLVVVIIIAASLPLIAQMDRAKDPLHQSQPPIPEEARRHEIIGTTLFKAAKSPDDYGQVIAEFKQAADLAPQWPEARYNLALAREAAGDYNGAIADLKIYLQFPLSQEEARKVQDHSYVLEAKGVEAQKAQVAAQRAAEVDAQRKRERFEKLGFLEGTWHEEYRFYMPSGRLYPGTPSYGDVEITIKGRAITIALKKGTDVLLQGTILGDDYSSIKWVKVATDAYKRNGGSWEDCPIEVNIDKANSRITWKEPSPMVTVGWDWSGHGERTLTR